MRRKNGLSQLSSRVGGVGTQLIRAGIVLMVIHNSWYLPAISKLDWKFDAKITDAGRPESVFFLENSELGFRFIQKDSSQFELGLKIHIDAESTLGFGLLNPQGILKIQGNPLSKEVVSVKTLLFAFPSKTVNNLPSFHVSLPFLDSFFVLKPEGTLVSAGGLFKYISEGFRIGLFLHYDTWQGRRSKKQQLIDGFWLQEMHTIINSSLFVEFSNESDVLGEDIAVSLGLQGILPTIAINDQLYQTHSPVFWLRGRYKIRGKFDEFLRWELGLLAAYLSGDYLSSSSSSIRKTNQFVQGEGKLVIPKVIELDAKLGVGEETNLLLKTTTRSGIIDLAIGLEYKENKELVMNKFTLFHNDILRAEIDVDLTWQDFAPRFEKIQLLLGVNLRPSKKPAFKGASTPESRENFASPVLNSLGIWVDNFRFASAKLLTTLSIQNEEPRQSLAFVPEFLPSIYDTSVLLKIEAEITVESAGSSFSFILSSNSPKGIGLAEIFFEHMAGRFFQGWNFSLALSFKDT